MNAFCMGVADAAPDCSNPADALANSPSTLLDLLERVIILEMELKSIRVEQDESKVSRRLLHEKLDRIIESTVEAKEGMKML